MPAPPSDTVAGLLFGSFVADALGLGAHWIYDQEERRRKFERVADFLDPFEDSYHPAKNADNRHTTEIRRSR